jgi:uncharacterized protein with GYD domain
VLVWEAPKKRPEPGRKTPMPIYVTLTKFTEKGVHHVKDTVKRLEAFEIRTKKYGVTVKDVVWTLGAHDMVTTAVILSAEELGNIRTETMRGFTAAEMEKLLAKVD